MFRAPCGANKIHKIGIDKYKYNNTKYNLPLRVSARNFQVIQVIQVISGDCR